MAQLIGVDRDASRSHAVTQAAQHLRVDPSGLAAAESVKRVEADLHPLAESDGFDVIDGHAILQRQPCNIGAQRETAIGRKVPEIDFHSTPYIGPHHRPRIAQRGAVEFAVAHQHDLADQFDDPVAALA